MEYQALQLVSSLEHYGVEWHWARDADGQRLAIGVGPEGIAVCKEDFALVNRWGRAGERVVVVVVVVVVAVVVVVWYRVLYFSFQISLSN